MRRASATIQCGPLAMHEATAGYKLLRSLRFFLHWWTNSSGGLLAPKAFSPVWSSRALYTKLMKGDRIRLLGCKSSPLSRRYCPAACRFPLPRQPLEAVTVLRFVLSRRSVLFVMNDPHTFALCGRHLLDTMGYGDERHARGCFVMQSSGRV